MMISFKYFFKLYEIQPFVKEDYFICLSVARN